MLGDSKITRPERGREPNRGDESYAVDPHLATRLLPASTDEQLKLLKRRRRRRTERGKISASICVVDFKLSRRRIRRRLGGTFGDFGAYGRRDLSYELF